MAGQIAATRSVPNLSPDAVIAPLAPLLPRRQDRFHRLRANGPVLLALFLLATSKWGSYLPFARPPYISDMAISLLVAARLLWRQASTRRRSGDEVLRILVCSLIFWCSQELVRGTFSINAIRDGAPYFYAILALLVIDVPTWTDRRAERIITAVMVFRVAWLSLVTTVPSIATSLPTLGMDFHLLTPRPDFDGAICGLFAALSLHRALSGRAIPFNLVMATANTFLLFRLRERAGLTAFVFELAIVLWLVGKRHRSALSRKARGVLPVLLICLPLLVLVGTQSVAYQRALAGLEVYLPFVHVQETVTTGGAQATTHARSKAWHEVISWLGTDSSKEYLGVGFGPDYLHQSGADVLLLGSANSDVRSPHNYFVNTWARLGLVGLTIVSAIVVYGLWLMVLVKRSAPALTDLDVLAFLLAVGIPAVAAVGVVLESPFGAVPYFWAIGYLSLRRVRLRDSEHHETKLSEPITSVQRPGRLPPGG